ncbi:hypothetical protein GW17_00031796 [Ensete ventricosum]|nr:hypothetical protein GW17_00031796 [Ensete ventricosum]
MLNSANKDRIFSSIRFPKASSFASIASFDAIVYASRSVILRSFFCCRVSGMGILEKGVASWKVNRFGWKFDLLLGWKVEARVVAIVGIAWERGGVDDGYRGSKIAALIPDDRIPEGPL